MKISQNDLFIDEKELIRVQQCIESRWLSEGPNTQEFAQKLSDFTGSRFTTFAPNGTLALFLALLALDLPKGSEIIIPTFTFYASAAAAVFAGLKPVFVDVDPQTFNVSPEKVEEAITPQTSAIMAVHIYGQACNIQQLCNIAEKHRLKVVEDAAQALGVRYQDRHVGSIGDVGIFSFFSDKTLTTGEGAAVVTNNEDLFQKLKLIRNQGRESAGTFIHPELGMNFRITDLQAAIGLSQFEKFPQIVQERLTKWRLYHEMLAELPEIETMEVAPFSNLVPFRFVIKTSYKESLSHYLEEAGIATRSFFYPMHLQPRLKEYPSYDCSNAEQLYEQGLCLPIHHHLKKADIEYICYKVQAFLEMRLAGNST